MRLLVKSVMIKTGESVDKKLIFRRKTLLSRCRVWSGRFVSLVDNASVKFLFSVTFFSCKSQRKEKKSMIVTDRFCTSLHLLPFCPLYKIHTFCIFRFSKESSKSSLTFSTTFLHLFLTHIHFWVVWYRVGRLHVG